jgi:hypothetical protein
MKTTTLVILATFAPLSASPVKWTDELRKIETQQVKLWQDTLESVRDKTPQDKLKSLSLGLRNMGYRRANYDSHSFEVDRMFEAIQSTMLSIPGHARYFAEEIKREQEKVVKYPTNTGPRVSYDFNRAKYFNTLAHLPSPETIAVLGEFLADDIDTPQPLMSPDSDWGENPRANSFAASVTISATGLRDAPADKKSYEADPESHLAKTRAWWEEVKSGKRTFSFKGQSVEYRFRPDGTWETIPIANPPDDGPKPVPAASDSGKRDGAPATVDSVKLADRSLLWWIAGITGVLLAVALALFIKFRRTA